MTRMMLKFAVALSAFLASISLGIQARAAEAGSEKFDPLALYLTWQGDPTKTMTIRWHSMPDDERKDVVEYQRFNETSWDSTAWDSKEGCHYRMVFSDRIVHVVELDSLDSGTVYWFRLGKDSAVFKFRTMPDSLTEEVRFIVGGDTYGRKELHQYITVWKKEWWSRLMFWKEKSSYYDIFRKTNLQASKKSPMFVVIGGDFTYSDGDSARVKRWYRWLDAWKKDMVTCDSLLIPLVPVIGNHEVVNNKNKKEWHKPDKPFDPAKYAPYFYNLFIPPDSSSYKVLDFGNYMRLILLDSGHTNFVHEQKEWLKRTLKARQAQTVLYKFAAYHVPAYPSAYCRSFYEPISDSIRTYWVPLFERFGLDVAFEHHDHTYKRTHPILKNKRHSEGVVYLGDGAWGKLRDPHPNRWYLAKAEKKYHFILVTLQKDKALFEAIDNDGQVFDTYCKLRDN